MHEIAVGDSAHLSKRITARDIEAFAELSLDRNPIHLDEAYAATTPFGKRIAHGYYVSSFISAVIGGQLPGPGSIYLTQELAFKAPVFIDDVVTATVEVVEIPKPGRFLLSTRCTNQHGDLVIDGQALIKWRAASS